MHERHSFLCISISGGVDVFAKDLGYDSVNILSLEMRFRWLAAVYSLPTLIGMRLVTMKQNWLLICVIAASIASGLLSPSLNASELKAESAVSAQSAAPIAPEILYFILKSDGAGDDETTQPEDTDGDGVADTADQCGSTPAGASVDLNGCADSQLDDDNDSVANDVDQCPSTPTTEIANANGCSPSQLDTDNDGVTDDLDQCPNTTPGVVVDEAGCEDTSGSLKDDYIQNVNPLITDFQRGCTSSGCHGRGNAPGGLSLYGNNIAGSDQQNYDSLVSYIDQSSVSRLLGKLSGTLSHGGGVRYGTGTSGYQVIKTWAEAVEAR